MRSRPLLSVFPALTGLLPKAALPVVADRESAQGGIGAPAKTACDWKADLPQERYRVLFAEGTEFAHSSPLNSEKREGTFICAACHQPLFASSRKYNSGSGWPSFWEALPGAVAFKTDYKLLMPRTEYHCSRCGGHQGHVFKDGPQPSGERYCNNGLALLFIPRGEPLPTPR
ncbi:peptide-methionine (R)-S-oxide reductase MsrB [Rhodocyclus tenuis]|uniref:peptide-methionine (R)-S-oxide reductase MsrB n=1 Tax=Rhodocyclus tenuis TaxID=1066 RepID=UPI00190421B1|nr:peptide-methionine (R)-S-oxide reductase MsrB [Rhodocyclus tenuis]MBK1681626.1 peptide-methionine (R)-S-oxide reductase [Rhodocyclus tenuis]